MNTNGTDGDAKGNREAAVGLERGNDLKAALGRLAAFVAHEASQPQFEFVERGCFPTKLSIIRDFVNVVTELLERETASCGRLAGRRDDIARDASSGRGAELNQEVLARVTAIEDALSSLEPVMQENVKLRQRDFQFGFVLPFATSIIRVVDGLERDLCALTQTTEHAATDREARMCRGMGKRVATRREELLNVLELLGIEPFVSAPLQPLDGTRHEVVESTVSRKREHEGRIAKHLRPGYWRRLDAWLVRPERVTVFMCQPVGS